MDNWHNIDPTDCILVLLSADPTNMFFFQNSSIPAVALQVGLPYTLKWYKDLFELLVQEMIHLAKTTWRSLCFLVGIYLLEWFPESPTMGMT